MIIKVTKVIHAEIGERSLDDLKEGFANEDNTVEGVFMETDFDKEGKVVTYLVLKQVTTVEPDESGEFKPTITVEPISSESVEMMLPPDKD